MIDPAYLAMLSPQEQADLVEKTAETSGWQLMLLAMAEELECLERLIRAGLNPRTAGQADQLEWVMALPARFKRRAENLKKESEEIDQSSEQGDSTGSGI